METVYPTPFLDMLKNGQMDRDTRLAAAQGTLGLRADEQRGVLELLTADPDPDVAAAATATLAAGPMTDANEASEPPDDEGEGQEAVAGDVKPVQGGTLERLAVLNPAQRLTRAMKGTREERAILIRDPNKIVALAVLSSPKISEAEVEAFARMTNVSDEVLRFIGKTRAWMKSYRIVSALTRNPKTPQALALNLLSRLQEQDVKLLISDRNVPDAIRVAARRRMATKR
jgi:hypothetical protein